MYTNLPNIKCHNSEVKNYKAVSSLISTKHSMLELLLEITGRGGQCQPL